MVIANIPSEIWFSAILAVATYLFITARVPWELTSILIMVGLALTRILTPAEAVAGFANLATVTIAAMFVLSEGMVRTGALELVSVFLGRVVKGSSVRLLLVLAATVPLLSAFINNTPVVVMMVPVIVSLCLRNRLSVSKILIPLSYFSILGGTMTLIGTSTNILVNELQIASGEPSFRMFTFAPMGAVAIAGGVLLIIALGDRLLPDRESAEGDQDMPAHAFFSQMLIPPGSALVGRRVVESFANLKVSQSMQRRVSRVRRLDGDPEPADENAEVRLLALGKGGTDEPHSLEPGQEFQAHDLVHMKGSAQGLAAIRDRYELEPSLAQVTRQHRQSQSSELEETLQAVLLSRSALIGRTLLEVESLRNFTVTIAGILTSGSSPTDRVTANTELASGDALLLTGPRSELNRVRDRYGLLYTEDDPKLPTSLDRKYLAIAIMALVVLGGALTAIPIAILALIGACIMVITGCLTTEQAFAALDTKTLMLIAGTIPLGQGMQTSGLSQRIADTLMASSAMQDNVYLTVSILFMVASVLSAFISNAAVAVLLVPIALQMAGVMGIASRPLLMAVCFGASSSFSTPIGYQTNTIVQRPGRYRYLDYARLGLPLQVLVWGLCTFLLPTFYPFK